MTFLMVLLVSSAVLACTLWLLLVWDDRRYRSSWGRGTTGPMRLLLVVSVLVFVVCGVVFFAGNKYFAGQGDGPAFARAWVQRWHPGVESVGYDDEQGDHKIEAIECGVNRWYHGYRVTGCRLMRGYSGSQP